MQVLHLIRRLPILVLFLVLAGQEGLAQRQWGYLDSTFHPINADTTLVAGRKKVYVLSAAGLQLHRDFTLPDTNYYIRDMDVVTQDMWYVLVGSRYIGNESYLYKTQNAGAAWSLDTSYYQAARFNGFFSNYDSGNQLQAIGQDTLVFFVGYYDSGIVYSLDGGTTWQPWFRNLIQHYHGLIPCRDSYFLYSRNGDGFSASMFRLPKRLLFSPDTGGAWSNFHQGSFHPPCYQGAAPGCTYANSNTPFHTQYEYFLQVADSLCATPMAVTQRGSFRCFAVHPNPAWKVLHIRLDDQSQSGFEVRILNLTGQAIQEEKATGNQMRMDVSTLPRGLHLLQVKKQGEAPYLTRVSFE